MPCLTQQQQHKKQSCKANHHRVRIISKDTLLISSIDPIHKGYRLYRFLILHLYHSRMVLGHINLRIRWHPLCHHPQPASTARESSLRARALKARIRMMKIAYAHNLDLLPSPTLKTAKYSHSRWCRNPFEHACADLVTRYARPTLQPSLKLTTRQDRRPISAPPIVQLMIYDEASRKELDYSVA